MHFTETAKTHTGKRRQKAIMFWQTVPHADYSVTKNIPYFPVVKRSAKRFNAQAT